jgi:hypothetical protein
MCSSGNEAAQGISDVLLRDFSVDVACSTSTLYASGFLLFVGRGRHDRHLVCVDARRPEHLLTATHLEYKDILGCPLSTDPRFTAADKESSEVLHLQMKEFRGDRLLGVFLEDRLFG